MAARSTPSLLPLALAISALLLAVALGLYVATLLIRDATDQIQTLRASVESDARLLFTPAAQVRALEEEIAALSVSARVLQELMPTVSARREQWPRVLGGLLSHDPERIRLLGLAQDGDELTLTGLAKSREDVLLFARVLELSDAYDRVDIALLEESELPFHSSPTAAPAVTPQPGRTTTPVAADDYEDDDFEPRVISVGEAQRHSFNPLSDVDQVVFLGKAGRRYCIVAAPQTLGVDTLLQVAVAEEGFSNDDCHRDATSPMACACPTDVAPGTEASLVEIQIPPYGDESVRVVVLNRGEFGPTQWYTLSVHEAQGDRFEDDDATARDIAIGEMQTHTFHPDGDIDQVRFRAKAGHAYELVTTDLALGVDTDIAIYLGSEVMSNDDVSPGNLSSRVVVDAREDGLATAVVTNRGRFGPAQTYSLVLTELEGDAYEPDHRRPSLITLYEEQRHTFFPEGDTDHLEFNVKAGRVYEVRTLELTIGVDTYLSVMLDGNYHESDDVSPGDPSSRVVVTAWEDGVAEVTVWNRDRFASGSEYTIVLNELAEEPTPTPEPTATVAPVPVCVDQYEPDDSVARPVAIAEIYWHTFCPDLDVDRAVFTAWAGHVYRVRTISLAPGVDTRLRVRIGPDILTNDDRAPGDLSSEVQVFNPLGADIPVFVRVSNGGSFGLGRVYGIVVEDLGVASLRQSGKPMLEPSRPTQESGGTVRFIIAMRLKHVA